MDFFGCPLGATPSAEDLGWMFAALTAFVFVVQLSIFVKISPGAKVMKSRGQPQARRARAMAARLRQEAEAATDPITRQRLVELAAQRDRLADQAGRQRDTKRPR